MKVIFEVTIFSPVPTPDFVEAEVESWVKSRKAAGDKIGKGIIEAFKTEEDYNNKLHKHHINHIKSFFRDDIRTRRGRTKKEIIDKVEAGKKDARKKHLKGVKDTFEKKDGVSKFDTDIDRARRYHDRAVRSRFMLKGSSKGNVKGLVELGIMALSGDTGLREYVHYRSGQSATDNGGSAVVFGGPVCITSPEKLKEFKKELRRYIRRWGADVIEAGYDEYLASYNSRKLNELVNKYRLPEIAPFSPGGESHIDFIVMEIPDPNRPGMRMKWLGLDIQVSKKD